MGTVRRGWTEFLLSGNVHLTGGVNRDSNRQTNEGDARRWPGLLDPKQKDNGRVAGHASQGTHSWHHVNKSPRWNEDSCIDEGLAGRSPEMGTSLAPSWPQKEKGKRLNSKSDTTLGRTHTAGPSVTAKLFMMSRTSDTSGESSRVPRPL